MDTQKIDGKCYVKMLLSGAALLAAHAQELNDLNVFPVPDGDTGTNMARTIEGGLAEVSNDEIESIGDLSKLFAKGVLLAARGNSGVILSQIFAGINEGLEAYDAVSAKQLAEAYRNGIKKSYEAVQNPTEGTILTVFRESTEYAATHINDDSTVEEFFQLHIDEARRSLAATKDILEALAEADVVDSGAAGYLYIAEGMYEFLIGKAQTEFRIPQQREKEMVNLDSFTRDSKLEYGYCTEVLIRLTTEKVDPDLFEVQTVLSVLEELGGESIVAYKQDDIVKVHVHTFEPGNILSRLQAFGEFLTVKIENMSLGHTEPPKAKAQKKKSKKFSVVSTALGDGMAALFLNMGVDQIIAGGQSSNPSAQEFIDAFRACDSEHILVLPNNKNVILAAQQAANLYTDAKIHVIETKNLMQGYSALSVITPGITDIEALVGSALRAASSVKDGEITCAVRDVVIDGIDIKQGDYIAISEGEIVTKAVNAEEAVLNLLELSDADLCEIITLFVGKNVTSEKRTELTEQLKELYEDCEIIVYEGGQDLYDYFLAIE